MIDFPTWLQTTLTIIGVIGGLAVGMAGIYLTVKSKVKDDTIDTLKENVVALQTQNEILKTNGTACAQAVKELTNKVDVLQTLPLAEMSKHMAEMAMNIAAVAQVVEGLSHLTQHNNEVLSELNKTKPLRQKPSNITGQLKTA